MQAQFHPALIPRRCLQGSGETLSGSGAANSGRSSIGSKKPARASIQSKINPRWTTEKVGEVMRRAFNAMPGRVRRALTSCDTRRSGRIAVEQLHELLQTFNLGMTAPQFAELLAHFDVVDGQISISDFTSYYIDKQAEVFELTPTVVNDMPIADLVQLMRKKLSEKTGAGANELRRSFKFFDRDSSGTIDHLEFQEAIKSLLNIYLSEDLAKKALVEFDADGNGEVDYQEFCNLVMKSNKQDSTSLNTKLSKEASMCAPAPHACALSLILILVRPLCWSCKRAHPGQSIIQPEAGVRIRTFCLLRRRSWPLIDRRACCQNLRRGARRGPGARAADASLQHHQAVEDAPHSVPRS